MYKLTVGSLLFIILFNSYSCWVINEINYKKLDLENKVNFADDTNLQLGDEALAKVNLIYPGTKWCGSGDIANDYNDLGIFVETDKCCRAHDHCPDVIVAGETKYNLTNTAFYTRLHCDCDEAFRKCLHDAKRIEATGIGKVYFNGIGTQCYRQDFPIIGCSVRGGWLNLKCLEYTYNTSADPLYQWFDVKAYDTS